MVNIGIAQHADEVVEREIEHAEPVHHRVGVGKRAEQQHRDRIEHQERQHGHERARPKPAGDDAKLCRPFGPGGRHGKCGGLCGHDPPLRSLFRPVPIVVGPIGNTRMGNTRAVVVARRPRTGWSREPATKRRHGDWNDCRASWNVRPVML